MGPPVFLDVALDISNPYFILGDFLPTRVMTAIVV